MTFHSRSIVLLLVLAPVAAAQNIQHGLRVPAGFEVVEVADGKLANDIYTMTLDPKGRIVVAGRGYIRLLVDDDGDGKADRAIEVADAPKDGAMGLLWEGDHLYFTGDGGLRRYRIKNDRADGPSELLCKLKTGGEHDAHAIRRGPDGWLYVLCGNNTQVDKLVKPSATSPITTPIAGCVLRFSPDFKTTEVYAHGFRNAYDMDFNSDGELFTFDSDNERCVSLPWYAPTQFYHVAPGVHYGWLSPQHASFWRTPSYFIGSRLVATLGRGSPTGCVCYRHGQFPEKYRGGFFLCDWTFGRVCFVALEKVSDGYKGRVETFLQSEGENGFAPTGAVVHPETGDLFVSIGGRGTRGAVYRIRYPEGLKGAKREASRWQFKSKHGKPYDGPPAGPVLCKPLPNPSAEVLEALLQRAQRMHNLSGLKKCYDASLEVVYGWQIAVGTTIPQAVRGTVWEGYARDRYPDDYPHIRYIRTEATKLFPVNGLEINIELSRLLAILEVDDPAVQAKVVARIVPASNAVEDIHYLIVLSRLRGDRAKAITQKTAHSLLLLDEKLAIEKANRDSNWVPRMVELHRELARKDPALNDALLTHKDFGRPDHVVWTHAPGFDRKKAATRFLARSKSDPSFAWNADLVRIVGELPDAEALPVLRSLWDRAGLNDVILPLLARRPAAEDHARFVQGLASPSLAVVKDALAALESLPPRTDGETLLALVQAMRLLPDGKDEEKTRARIGRMLRALTKQDLAENDKQAWVDWLTKTHPKEAAKLGGEDGVDAAAWSKRLKAIDWDAGDAERGKAVFTKASCVACHSGSQAMGPDLRGVAGRFSRDDLFTAILRPSKDVPVRYRTTLLMTDEGKTYQGIIVYEAVDSVLLQTGPATTVRLAHKAIVEKRVSPLSLMPTGLLDRLGDRDIADLYRYLRSLKP